MVHKQKAFKKYYLLSHGYIEELLKLTFDVMFGRDYVMMILMMLISSTCRIVQWIFFCNPTWVMGKSRNQMIAEYGISSPLSHCCSCNLAEIPLCKLCLWKCGDITDSGRTFPSLLRLFWLSSNLFHHVEAMWQKKQVFHYWKLLQGEVLVIEDSLFPPHSSHAMELITWAGQATGEKRKSLIGKLILITSLAFCRHNLMIEYFGLYIL